MLLQVAEEMEGDEGEFSARSGDQQVQIPTRHAFGPMHIRATHLHIRARPPAHADSVEGGGEGAAACGKQSVPTQDIYIYVYIYIALHMQIVERAVERQIITAYCIPPNTT